MTKDQNRNEKMVRLFDRADEILDAAVREGEPFTESLCNWATHQAEQELGNA